MTTAKDIALESLHRTAALDLEGLGALMHDHITMRFPFAPEGIPNHCHGRDQCLAMSKEVFASLNALQWIDLEAFATEDPEVVFLTARSKAETRAKVPYANQYCFKIRVRDGQVIEHTEFFNPLPIMAAFT